MRFVVVCLLNSRRLRSQNYWLLFYFILRLWHLCNTNPQNTLIFVCTQTSLFTMCSRSGTKRENERGWSVSRGWRKPCIIPTKNTFNRCMSFYGRLIAMNKRGTLPFWGLLSICMKQGWSSAIWVLMLLLYEGTNQKARPSVSAFRWHIYIGVNTWVRIKTRPVIWNW